MNLFGGTAELPFHEVVRFDPLAKTQVLGAILFARAADLDQISNHSLRVQSGVEAPEWPTGCIFPAGFAASMNRTCCGILRSSYSYFLFQSSRSEGPFCASMRCSTLSLRKWSAI